MTRSTLIAIRAQVCVPILRETMRCQRSRIREGRFLLRSYPPPRQEPSGERHAALLEPDSFIRSFLASGLGVSVGCGFSAGFWVHSIRQQQQLQPGALSAGERAPWPEGRHESQERGREREGQSERARTKDRKPSEEEGQPREGGERERERVLESQLGLCKPMVPEFCGPGAHKVSSTHPESAKAKGRP